MERYVRLFRNGRNQALPIPAEFALPGKEAIHLSRHTEMMPATEHPSVENAINHYLRTGDSDIYFAAWEGNTLIERSRRATPDLKGALSAAVRRRAGNPAVPPEIRDLDLVTFTRRKLTPMISGLFPANERDTVLRLFDPSVVFLTPDTIHGIIVEADWLSTAWTLAGLYLESVGAQPLGEAPLGIVGLSEETTCYVSMQYFTSQSRFADFVMHEAAHVFHNCKRSTAGLPETRTREWLLDIDYRKRETFAYACEAYGRILELGNGHTERRQLVAELARAPAPADETVDPGEYIDIVREAVAARNGWKRILTRCAPRHVGMTGTHAI